MQPCKDMPLFTGPVAYLLLALVLLSSFLYPFPVEKSRHVHCQQHPVPCRQSLSSVLPNSYFCTWGLWNDSLNQNAVLSWQQKQSIGREKGFKPKARLYTSFLSKSSLSTECLTYPSWAFGGTDWSQSSESAVLVIASAESDHFLQQSFSVLSGHHWIAGHGRTLLFKYLRHPAWTSVSKFRWKAVSECDHQEEWQQQRNRREAFSYLLFSLFFLLSQVTGSHDFSSFLFLACVEVITGSVCCSVGGKKRQREQKTSLWTHLL